MTQKDIRFWRRLFALYAVLMLILLFGRKEPSEPLPYWVLLTQRIQLIPLRTLVHQFKMLDRWDYPPLIVHGAVNLIGNVLLFLPLGIFLPKLQPRLNRLWKVLAVAAGIVILIEVSQALTLLGRCDIDDLILNLLGSAIGYWLYRQFFSV